MNRLSPLFLLPVLMIASTSKSQVKPDLLNVSLTEPKRKVAYAGVKNIFIMQGNLPGKQIRIERSGGPLEIKAGTSVSAVVRFDQPGWDTLRLYVDDKPVVEKPIEILELRTYKAVIRGADDPSIDPEKLLGGARLVPVMPGTWYKPSSRIESYRITLTSASRGERSFLVEGAKLPPELDAKSLQGVTRIRFDRIRMRKEDGKTITLDELEYKINVANTTTPPDNRP